MAMLPASANTPTLQPARRASAPVPQGESARPAAFASLPRKLSVLPARYLRCSAIFFSFLFLFASTLSAQTTTQRKKKKAAHPKSLACQTGCQLDTTSPALDAATPEDAQAQKELTPLARELHRGAPGSYEKVAEFANKHASSVWGQRAALALGYDDYSKGRFPQAQNWFEKAKPDPLLREYILFWNAQTERALHNNAEAARELSTLLTDYPNTVMKEQVLEVYAPTAVEIGHPKEALEALASFPATSSKPSLILIRARAYESTRKLVDAVKDYQTLYYKYPLSDESKDASLVLTRLNKQLRDEAPRASVELQNERAEAFYNAHKWKEARAEYEKLASMLKDPTNATRQRALVRSAECRQHPKAAPRLFASLNTSDSEADAERLYSLAQAYRSDKNETEMLSNVEKVAEKYPQSHWAEEALMATGNYYWVLLDRDKAAHYYERVLEKDPSGKNAYNAEWRIAWVAYLEKQAYADDKMAVFLRKYPVSSGAVNALYWLGRNAERSGNPAHARAYFQKTIDRYPTTYFAEAAESHLQKLGPGETEAPDFLAQIPPAPPLRPFDEPIATNVIDRWNRAQALRTIAFDASAELELKAAYTATASPRFLIEAAQAAFDQGHFSAGMNYGRLALVSFDSRKFTDVPENVWKVLFPLPYESQLRREAERNDFDPMFAAGLIRQESTFQADAVSHANAIGLMQILPKEGRRLAKERKVRYTKATLFDPDLNIQLGMLYISELTRSTGAPEYAAAAYDAGADRVVLWKAERPYEEIPEFVESIPFSETREYVQIVVRNAGMYRKLYSSTTNKNTVSASIHSGSPASR
jgi:soluble lytic murein transglycosylase